MIEWLVALGVALLGKKIHSECKKIDEKYEREQKERELQYEQDDDEKYDEEIFLECEQDERGIYYLINYAENKDYIWEFKEEKEYYTVYDVAFNVLQNLKRLAPGEWNVVLTSVPSSEKGKTSAMDEVIAMITQDQIDVDLTDYAFHDGSNVFSRKKDVKPLHKLRGYERREATIKNMKTISCSIEGFKKDDVYVILDDVTTSGETMLACKRKLMEQGVAEDDIICFALAKTEKIFK